MRYICDDVAYVGVDDLNLDLFEGMYRVPNGVSYNSYVIKDEKIAVMDTVDGNFSKEWLENLDAALDGRQPDYLVVLHMEPDHSANILNFIKKYPNAKIVGNRKTFVMIEELFGAFEYEKYEVTEGGILELGAHSLKFVFAPMVHWPEVMMAYDGYNKTLYSADAFGKFGALKKGGEWEDEARRYYYGIVGKYGVQVQALFKKLSAYEIGRICPLHGPVLDNNLNYYFGLYNKWSTYAPEKDGVMIAYTSVYGHTKEAALSLAEKLKAKNIEVVLYDLARADWAECVAKAFEYGKLVLATTTYNGEIFPAMREFIDRLTERNYQSRKVALIENGSWAPVAARAMQTRLEKCKNLTFLETQVKIRSALNEESKAQIDALANELSK